MQNCTHRTSQARIIKYCSRTLRRLGKGRHRNRSPDPEQPTYHAITAGPRTHPPGAAPTGLSTIYNKDDFTVFLVGAPEGSDFSFSARTPTEPGMADIADGCAVGREISVFLVGAPEGSDFSFLARTPTEPGVADVTDGRAVSREISIFLVGVGEGSAHFRRGIPQNWTWPISPMVAPSAANLRESLRRLAKG